MSAPDKGFKSLPGWLGDFKVLFNYILTTIWILMKNVIRVFFNMELSFIFLYYIFVDFNHSTVIFFDWLNYHIWIMSVYVLENKHVTSQGIRFKF